MLKKFFILDFMNTHSRQILFACLYHGNYCHGYRCRGESLQALIDLICDVKAMEDTVIEMKYDPKKAPLGMYMIVVV